MSLQIDSGLVNSKMQRLVLDLGYVPIAARFLLPQIQKFGLGRLPGDFVVERRHFRLYIPPTTSLLFSIALTLVLWFTNRLSSQLTNDRC